MFFETSLRRLLGPVLKRDQLTTGAGRYECDLFAAPEVEIQTKPVMTFRSDELVVCSDLSSASSVAGIKNLGVLGMDFLHSRMMRLGFDTGIGEFRSVRSDNSGHVARIHFENALPRLLVRLSSDTLAWLLIDAGDTGVVTLSHQRFDQLVGKEKIVLTGNGTAAVVGAVVGRRTGILDSLDLGPHRFFNVRVAEGRQDAIGMRFLSKFEVEFDFPKGVAVFRPGKRIDLSDRRDRAGLGIGRNQGATFALSVRRDTATP